MRDDGVVSVEAPVREAVNPDRGVDLDVAISRAGVNLLAVQRAVPDHAAEIDGICSQRCRSCGRRTLRRSRCESAAKVFRDVLVVVGCRATRHAKGRDRWSRRGRQSSRRAALIEHNAVADVCSRKFTGVLIIESGG